MKRLWLLVAALIVYGSLYPWHFVHSQVTNPLGVVLRGWPEYVDRQELRDVALNVLLYMPLGMLAFLALARHWPGKRAAVCAFALGASLSLAMETAQVYVPGRVPSILDVITNALGTALGVAAAIVLRSQIESLARMRRSRLAGSASLLLVCWAVCQLFPFFPAITHPKLYADVAAIRNGWPPSPADVWDNAAEWFAALLAARAILGRLRWWWPCAAFAIIAPRIAIATRVVTPNEVAGAVLAWMLWIAIPEPWKLRAGIAIVASALLLRELAPFHFQVTGQPFSWIPLVATLDSDWQLATVILARKVFDYGAMVWLLRKSGISYARAGFVVAAALFGLELLQIYLPGRTPEITDAVLAILMAVALWLSDRSVLPAV